MSDSSTITRPLAEDKLVEEAQKRRRRMLESLKRLGKLTPLQTEELLAKKHSTPIPIDEELEELGYLSTREVVSALAEHFRYPAVDLSQVAPDPELRHTLPVDVAQQYEAVPIGFSGPELQVAIADPSDIRAEDAVRMAALRPVSFFVGAESQLLRLIDNLYELTPTSIGELERFDTAFVDRLEVPEPANIPARELEKQAATLPTIRMANQILAAAAQRGASDIHFEPQDSSLVVRMRIDGVLQNFLTLPKTVQPPLISRIKLMGEMDISDSRRPQDGRCRVAFNRHVVDLRISSLPTTFGEKIVIRLLDQSGPPKNLDSLDMDPIRREQVERMLSQHQGLLLVTGPTGSGKSTTLYAFLSHLKKGNTNIVTVEDPVERQMEGINQVAINERAGVTFASALRSILRQDPNIIMVGEIRDEETAEMAMKAGLTGHLVLSTMHTNDAPSAITRLFDMGIPGPLLSPALIGIVAQRLVRRICTSCHGRENPDATHARGCQDCGYSGFKGRTGVYEILEVTPALAGRISQGGTAEEIRTVAMANGMQTLYESAMERVDSGVTTIQEVAAVVDMTHPGINVDIPSVATYTSTEKRDSGPALRNNAGAVPIPGQGPANQAFLDTPLTQQPLGAPVGAPVGNAPYLGQTQAMPPQANVPIAGQPAGGQALQPVYQGPQQGYPGQGYPGQGYVDPNYPANDPYGRNQYPPYPAPNPMYPHPPVPAVFYSQAPPHGVNLMASGAFESTPLPPKVLVVEDSWSIRQLLVSTLESNCYTVLQAEDGLQGVKMAISELPDLVLTDVVMPNLDGFELCKHLRSHPRTRHIPIIMLTSQSEDEDEIRGLEVGADDYILKPINPKRLVARIHLTLRKRIDS